jgi:fatty acid desaturase
MDSPSDGLPLQEGAPGNGRGARLIDRLTLVALCIMAALPFVAITLQFSFWWSVLFIVIVRWQFLIQHVDSHRPLVRSSVGRFGVDYLLQLSSPMAPVLFRYSHVQVHHRFNNTTDDWTGPFSYRGTSFPSKSVGLPRYLSTFLPRIWVNGIRAARSGIIPRRRAVVGLGVFVAAFTTIGVFAWWAPARVAAFIGAPMLVIWFGSCLANWAHHSRATYETPLRSAVNNPRLTSTALGFNIGYHAAHHASPGAHWLSLPRIHLRMCEREGGYPGLWRRSTRDSVRLLRRGRIDAAAADRVASSKQSLDCV